MYELSAFAVVENFSALQNSLNVCPEPVLFDVIYQIYRRKQAARLITELSHFPTFAKLLKVGDKRARLHKMMQATVELRAKVPDILAQVKQKFFDIYSI